MLSIRSLLKKENGTCPICALPYVREKRTLRASYFDNTYGITVWILRCAECGCEVIQPGAARIGIYADDQRGSYAKEAEEPPLDIKITAPLPGQKTGIGGPMAIQDGKPEAAKDPDAPDMPGAHEEPEEQVEDPTGTEAAEAGDPRHGESHKAAGLTGQADKAESPEPNGASMLPDPAEGKVEGTPMAQDAGNRPDSKAMGKQGQTEDPEKGKSEGTGDAKAQASVKENIPSGNGTGNSSTVACQPGSAGKAEQDAQVDGDGTTVSREEPGADTGTRNPAAVTDGERAQEGTEKPATGTREKGHQEEKATTPGRGMDTGRPQQAGQAKEKSTRQGIKAQDKKTLGAKGSDRERAVQGTPPGQEPAGVQKKPAAADGWKPHTPPGSSSQPVLRGRQPGAFPGGIQSGFPGGGMFPPSAFSNLEALRAFIHTDMGRQEKGKEPLDAVEKKEPGEPESDRPRTPVPDKQLSAGNGGKEGQKKASGKKEEKAEKAGKGNMDPGISADSQNPARISARDIQEISTQKTVSAENHRKPDKKSLSAEPVGINAEVSARKTAEGAGKADELGNPANAGQGQEVGGNVKPAGSEKPADAGKPVKGGEAPEDSSKPYGENGPEKEKPDLGTGKEPGQESEDKAVGADQGNGDASPEKTSGDTKEEEAQEAAEGQEGRKEEKKEKDLKDLKEQAVEATRKLSDRLPADLVEKIPVISQISKQQKHALFISEEKRFLEQHVPHKQVIINDLAYDTDNSEMFLKTEGRYGLDNPCMHYNYRTGNGNFFRCTVKYKQEDSIRPLDLIEAKRMLEEHPDLYKKFFPDSVSDA